MEEKYLITDASVETVSAFEVLTEELEHAGTTPVGGGGRSWSLFSSCSGSNPGGPTNRLSPNFLLLADSCH